MRWNVVCLPFAEMTSNWTLHGVENGLLVVVVASSRPCVYATVGIENKCDSLRGQTSPWHAIGHRIPRSDGAEEVEDVDEDEDVEPELSIREEFWQPIEGAIRINVIQQRILHNDIGQQCVIFLLLIVFIVLIIFIIVIVVIVHAVLVALLATRSVTIVVIFILVIIIAEPPPIAASANRNLFGVLFRKEPHGCDRRTLRCHAKGGGRRCTQRHRQDDESRHRAGSLFALIGCGRLFVD
mmetsp:Transcript_20644/g.57350  ORF Transcript_20644/g.57350 Transcript_20644/m.57350 type:complete len:239 (+) Transcript_20644:516-1232(+)